ncbi:lactonase family protein [Clostridium manihotivorum]|uniref:6-phosphogluconolactonase n=1 Tax=Clostridium manihotivorum TaxID=2320868 RepID=A0A410DZ14_9CLOT|nr:lactonase family protein [Clostridium manihotivorum]QAA34321.1 6-phosphogluconolactonase [Clostridium manihotivorum]
MNDYRKNSLVYVGTYTYGDSKGLYSFELNHETCKTSNLQLVAELSHPTYVATCKEKNLLYSVIKQEDLGGTRAFKIKSDHTLSEINTILAEGKSPCHLSFDKNFNYVFSGNYHEATITIMRICEDGSLSEPTEVVKHTGKGSGIVADRQEKPHVHYCALTPDEKFLAVVDLGLDATIFYPFNKLNGTLDKHNKIVIPSAPGSGPRHLIFHNSLNYFYIIHELSADVEAYAYNSKDCTIEKLQTINTLPKDFSGDNLGAAIRISPNGKFLYTSNRGSDTISIFKIDEHTGLISFIHHVSTFGKGPRDFSFDPSGKFLIVANQNTDSVIFYEVNCETGLLTKLEEELAISNPVCISISNL